MAKKVVGDDASVVAQGSEGEAGEVHETTHEESRAGMGAAIGAGIGAAIGGTGGLLAGLGLLAIPGFGPIIAAGPIAAALTGASVGAGGGGTAGALIGVRVMSSPWRSCGRCGVMYDRDDSIYSLPCPEEFREGCPTSPKLRKT